MTRPKPTPTPTGHAHRWRIDSPAGPTSAGRCTACGATREFANVCTRDREDISPRQRSEAFRLAPSAMQARGTR